MLKSFAQYNSSYSSRLIPNQVRGVCGHRYRLETDATDDISKLNEAAGNAYFNGNSFILSNIGTILSVGSTSLYLTDGDKTTTYDYIPNSYTILKSLSHLLLGVTGGLLPFSNSRTDTDQWLPNIQQLYEAAKPVYDELDSYGLEEPALSRNRYMMGKLLDYLNKVIVDKYFDTTELYDLAYQMGPFTLANAYDSAQAQIDLLDSKVEQIANDLGQDKWMSTMVAIEVSHQPRSGYLQTQYFSYKLGERAQSQLVVGENISDGDVQSVKSLIATVLEDRMIATYSYRDRYRLERDLLSDAADAYLLRKFGKLGTPEAPEADLLHKIV